MNTYLGASSYLAPADVDEALVKSAKVVYLEGYMSDRPAAKAAFQKAGEIARAASRRVALTLSESFCVESVPRRIHRAHAFTDGRHDLRQHRRDPVAIPDAELR